MAFVFERFSDRARRVVVLSQEEARLLNHNWIGTEHLLLGLMRTEEGAGFSLLQILEAPLAAVRDRVIEIIPRGEGAPLGHIPFTPRAKKVLEMSLREALRLGDHFIGSEHLLLGLLREGDGVGAQVLREHGVTLAAVEARLGDVEREQAPADSPSGDEDVVDEGMIHVPAEHFARLVAEVARLRDLLRHHGLDPDEVLPPESGIGDDGDTPVA
jgi:ATP-dependent Clp protease ATP-binding subunit ClpC